MSARHLVVVDAETTSLNTDVGRAVEIAWWNLTTDRRGYILPLVASWDLAAADPESLEINGYYKRGLDKASKSPREAVEELRRELAGHTLAGSNPAFDAAMLNHTFRQSMEWGNPWHHRFWDLAPYAAGVLGLDELPGLAKVCDLLDVEPGDHTAENDVTATGLCFKALQALVVSRTAVR